MSLSSEDEDHGEVADGWARTINIANMGWFSSDRTIREYADEIWRAPVF